MRVLIVGAAGMIGRRLTASLLADPALGPHAVEHLVLADAVPPEAPAGTGATAVELAAADIGDPAAASRLLAGRPDLVVHLAAVVSGEAEADFDKGTRVNLDGTRNLLDAIRRVGGGYRPRVVFASSIAVFGAPFPDPIGDEFLLAPLTSYGTQKAIGELLLADYSRRGFLDGIGLRLPTICVRPGAPNRAASGFFSSILREPLAGREAVLPVGEDVRHWFASPRAAVGFLRHAATLDLARLGPRRSLTMPGLSATVGDEIEALRRAAGEAAVRLIRREPDPAVAAIVAGWPPRFDARRAETLGFVAERSMDEIVRAHLEDGDGERLGHPRGVTDQASNDAEE